MKEVYNIEDLSVYNKFDKIVAKRCDGSITEIMFYRCKEDFTISKFYKKDIENLWADAEREIPEDTYLDTTAKATLLKVFRDEKEYCWEIQYLHNGFDWQSYNEVVYLENDLIENQDDIDVLGEEILDWVYMDCQSWKFEKDNQ